MSKRSISFEMSFDRYFKGFASCYLWTITLPIVCSTDEFRDRWNRMQIYMRRKGWSGIRVYELHPGGHGWHVHLVTRSRIDVNEFRIVAHQAGFGRVHVKRIPVSAGKYIGKYLQKSFEDAVKGVRLLGFIKWADWVRQSSLESYGTIGAHMRTICDETVKFFFPSFDDYTDFRKFKARYWCSSRQVLLGAICEL